MAGCECVGGAWLLSAPRSVGDGLARAHLTNARRLRLYRALLGCAVFRCAVSVVADIAPPDGAPVRPFHVDPRFNTPKEVADKLWDAIGAATGLTAVGGVLAVGGSGSR